MATSLKNRLVALMICALLLATATLGCGPAAEVEEDSPSRPSASASEPTDIQPEEQSESPGSGTATAQGYGGPVTVSLVVEGGAIVSVHIQADQETPALGGRAAEIIAADLLASGEPQADAVSGATSTSNAALVATAAAYAQATGTSIEVHMAPGTYTAEAIGFALSEPLSVSVTVSEQRMESIVVDMDNTETRPILQSVVDLMVPRMIEHQSISVDSITGATGSSSGVRQAVTTALSEALAAGGSDVTALAAFLNEMPKTGWKETREVDVLVVGMGGSGTAAAVSAAETLQSLGGGSILAIDKAGKYGGTAANTQEMTALNPPRFIQEHNGGEDYVDVAAFREAWINHTEGDEKTEFVDFMLERSGEMLDWLVYEHGYDMSEPQTGFTENDVYRIKFQYMPNHTAANKHIIGTYFDGMYRDYAALGGEYLLETEAYELIVDNAANTVRGVRARNLADGTEYEITAKSVILATGGFAGNQDMEEAYLSNEYYPLNGRWNLFGMQQNDGKMIEAAIQAGAGTYNIGMSPMVHLAGPPVFLSGFEKHYLEDQTAFFTGRPAVWSASDLAIALTTAPNMLLVGKDGNRFTDESAMFSWWMAGPGYYSILSQTELDAIRDQGLEFGATGAYVYVGHQTAIPTGVPLPETEAVISAGIDAGYIYKADTLEELAGMIAVDSAALAATFETYNASCDAGVDGEFGKGADYLTPISGEGPFYAVYGESYPFSTCGGLDINLNFNVLLSDGQTPINGLYAVGTDAMGVLFTEKRDYVTFGGVAQGWAYTSGYFAGQYAATDAVS